MYELIETKNNDISSYGIKCGNVRIEDISTKKNTVERLVSMANQYDLPYSSTRLCGGFCGEYIVEVICMFDKELFEKICTDYGIELVESHEQGITLTDSTKVYKSEEDFKELLLEFLINGGKCC